MIAVDQDELFMNIALEEAKAAFSEDEVPIGAAVVYQGAVTARAHNCPVSTGDPTAHAEVLAIRESSKKLGNYRLAGATLYVTLEPCIMCVGAIVQARIARVVYGAADPKGGGVSSLYRIFDDGKLNHVAEVRGGVLESECGEILSRFFRKKRV